MPNKHYYIWFRQPEYLNGVHAYGIIDIYDDEYEENNTAIEYEFKLDDLQQVCELRDEYHTNMVDYITLNKLVNSIKEIST